MFNLSEFISFLFINSKINSLLFFNSMRGMRFGAQGLIEEAMVAKSIYKKQIRRYLGLGFFLSFIPGTESYLARKNLLSVISRIEAKVEESGKNSDAINPLHFFMRTFYALTYNHLEVDFSEILIQENYLAGINRLNPFLYLTQLAKLLILNSYNLLCNLKEKAPNFVQITLWLFCPIILPIYMTGLLACLIGLVCYFITELILNSLNTLLIEPFQFVFEVIMQNVKNSHLEFSYLPTDDYLKQAIMNAYNHLKNLRTFNDSTSQVFPQELRQHISNISLKLEATA